MNREKGTRAQGYKIVLAGALMICCVFFCHRASGESSAVEEDSLLKIYLPREVAIEDDSLSLGEISIIRGDESLAAKAGEVAFGRISALGQEIIVDRPTILSRLASSGIPASKVIFTGAEKITVGRQNRIIKGGELVEMASSSLKENLTDESICQLEPVRIPKDLIISNTAGDIELSSHLVKNNTKNRAKVQIVVLADGEEAGTREVTFRLKYNCRKAITAVELAAGTVISSDNVRIEEVVSDYPEPANWSPPYGLVANHRLAANTVIKPSMVGMRRSEVVIKRNQSVVIRFERPGFSVTAIGRAMKEARAGEYIRVRNVDSQRIILAKVNEDGTVEPVL